MVFSVVVLLFKYNFYFRNIYILCPSSKKFARLRLFISLRVLSEAKPLSHRFYTTVVNDGLHELFLLLTNSSFILILSDSHRGCLIWVKFVKIQKQKFESQLNVIKPFSIL